MDDTNNSIEQQLTTLFRRVQRIHLSTATGEVTLDRSAYGIMCRLDDEGPARLGSIATAFGLDPSTITRQVQALERAGLAERSKDPKDRRAAILDLTEVGRTSLHETREHRRQRLEQLLEPWSGADRSEFARLLTRFNQSVEDLTG